MHDTTAVITTHAGRKPDTWVVTLSAAFTLPGIFAFQEKVGFLKSHEAVKSWIVDLSSVPYMDSAGLGCLINLYVSSNKNGQRFALAGANHRLVALLETARVQTMLLNYPTLAAAEDAVEQA